MVWSVSMSDTEANRCSHSQPADAGGSIKPGVERGSAEPQEDGVTTHQAHEAGGGFLLFAISSLRLRPSLPPASRACAINRVVPGVPLRSTPGSAQTPASAG